MSVKITQFFTVSEDALSWIKKGGGEKVSTEMRDGGSPEFLFNLTDYGCRASTSHFYAEVVSSSNAQ